MDRKERKRNRITKEINAMTILLSELKLGNRQAANVYQRILTINIMMQDLEQMMEPPESTLPFGGFAMKRFRNKNSFNKPLVSILRKFISELEEEKRLLINTTLKSGTPMQYLEELYNKQRKERTQKL